MLTVHHLQVSQSERIIWLCEELGLDYELKLYKRSPILSPPQYLALHPIGAAPVIQDGELTLAESAACVEYIINIHGNGRLTIKPGQKGYADYLYWFHFANGTLQPAMRLVLGLRSAGVDENHSARYENRVKQCLDFVDRRLGETHAWLAGDEMTAADIMIVFSLTTMRKFYQMDLTNYGNILVFLQNVADREAYLHAMKESDPDMNVQDAIQGRPPALFEALRR